MALNLAGCSFGNIDFLPHALSGVSGKAQSMLHAIWGKVLHFNPLEHRMLVATWGTFMVAATIAFYLEFKADKQIFTLRNFLAFCFPASEWKGHSARTDVVLYFIGKITDPVLGAMGLLLTGVITFYVSKYLSAAGFPVHATKGGVIAAIGLGLVFFLANDFANFLTHLAEHQVPFLWEFHKVHHTATFLSPLTTAREHPLVMLFDSLVGGTFVGILAGAAKVYFGFSVPEMLGMAATANTFGTLVVLDSIRHSQFPVSFGWFDKLLISPHMHQLHHSLKEAHWNKNMGNKLAIWDGMFKTIFFPLRDEKLAYGSGSAEEDHEYRSALRCYAVPFVKNYQSLKAAFAKSRERLEEQPVAQVEERETMSKVA
jgi:sterol desaturase/sphingolipid hydroxylase (fatty acid hydroxylase superfamily)